MVHPDKNEGIKDQDFAITALGTPCMDSPLTRVNFVGDDKKISYLTDVDAIQDLISRNEALPAFEAAGPRRKIYHDPAWSRAAIVTCGGLCPGINDVLKALVNTLYYAYGVDKIFGIQYGYRGLIPKYGLEPIVLNPDVVDTIHENGGSILGSSRGQQDTDALLRTLDRLNINMLFCIGGDGTLRAARELAEAALAKRLALSVIGLPKTIDNDVCFMERTFGFETAVYAAAEVITCAHAEAKGAYNGIGLVRLMGRDAGFLAAYAALANSVVNFCLVPEFPFTLEGAKGFLTGLEHRLAKRHHAVIVVAEGAGQQLFEGAEAKRDASGNILHQDIGIYLKDKISSYLRERKVDFSMKYFDPSYEVRSVTARGTDAVFCLHLAENAVHAAMAGKTNLVVGYWNGHFTHVPIALATRQRRHIDLHGQLWRSVLMATRQQEYWPIEANGEQ